MAGPTDRSVFCVLKPSATERTKPVPMIRRKLAGVGALAIAMVVIAGDRPRGNAPTMPGMPGRAVAAQPAASQPSSPSSAASLDPRQLLDRYCVGCHNGRLKTADLLLDAVDPRNVGPHSET